jgi:azurin
MKHTLLPLIVVLSPGLATAAQAEPCQLSIDANDNMQFSTRQLEAPASCPEVTLTLHHVGKLAANVMGHNWVLTRSRDANAVSNLGPAAGLQHDYLPSSDARVIAATKIIGGGQTVTISFSTTGLKPEEDYTFFCSAPGHIALMKGKFLLKK